MKKSFNSIQIHISPTLIIIKVSGCLEAAVHLCQQENGEDTIWNLLLSKSILRSTKNLKKELARLRIWGEALIRHAQLISQRYSS